MVISKELLSDYKEIYEEAIRMVNEQSQNDPQTEPFRSHYAARELLLQLKENVKNDLDTLQPNDEKEKNDFDEFTFKSLLAFLCRDLGAIYVFTEEVPNGEIQLNECLQIAEPCYLRPEIIVPYIGALHELGIVNANREQYQKAFEYLRDAEKAYMTFKDSKEKALSVTDVFGTRDEIEPNKGSNELDSLYTLCTFYLAQVYGHMGELEKSSLYCHMTLQRQISLKSYEPIDFALNAATLSQYFIGKNLFKEARHHLAAATLVIKEHEEKLASDDMTEEQRTHGKETYNHRYADIARCWAKYGLVLLSASKDRLYNDDDDKLAADIKLLKVKPETYIFEELDVAAIESKVSCDYCLTFDDAKLVYHFVNNWLDIAIEYYKAENEATEYSKIVKDYAELYQHIAFFEEKPANQIKMQKRRAKYYEELLQMLNPRFYMSICRDCWCGAALAHCAVLDIRLDEIKGNRNPTPYELHKINQACEKAIKHFIEYINSYMDKDGVTQKAISDVDEQRNLLYSYCHLGRLYYKMLSSDPEIQLENMNNSLKYYKLFTEEVPKHKDAASSLQAEMGVCREMANLLPLKIANVKNRIGK